MSKIGYDTGATDRGALLGAICWSVPCFELVLCSCMHCPGCSSRAGELLAEVADISAINQGCSGHCLALFGQ